MAESASPVPVKELILVPSVITLGITLLRLVGELQNWSPLLFGKAAGGGGALVGISWLIPVLGVYFALRLVKLGHAPKSGGRTAGFALLAFLVVMAVSFPFGRISQNAFFFAFTLGAVAAIFVTARLWPALWRTLVAYAFAARIPVAIVMLVAILGNWGTHYDVPPDANFPAYSQIVKWALIGLLPQMTVWIYLTVVGGLVFGGVTAAIAGRRK